MRINNIHNSLTLLQYQLLYIGSLLFALNASTDGSSFSSHYGQPAAVFGQCNAVID